MSLQDVGKGIVFGVWYSQHHIVHSFFIIPVGIVVLLAILYGFNELLANVFHITFPASVLGMLVNLVFLCVLSGLSSLGAGNSRRNWLNVVADAAQWVLEHYLLVIKPLMNFTLKWINVFFIPSFIILPLSDHITFIECLKIAAVFLVGWIVLMLFDVYMIMALKWVLRLVGVYSFSVDKDEKPDEPPQNDEEIELFDLNRPYISARDDITTIDMSSLRAVRTEPAHHQRSLSVTENPFDDKFHEVQRVSTVPPGSGTRNQEVQSTAEDSGAETSDLRRSASASPVQAEPASSPSHMDLLSPLAQKTVIFTTNYIDWFLYLALFVVSLPFYYVGSIHVMLPYHMGITVLAYYVALLIPMQWPQSKKFAHPILVLTAEILFVCFIGSLIFGNGAPETFLKDLKYYKTGKNYLKLFDGIALWNNGEVVPQYVLEEHYTAEPLWPGCGDFLSSLMDISIVSLSLPMFTHRRDFVKNFWVLMPTILVSMAVSFFCYPIICYSIGISAERSIGFIGRLVTLALGTPLISSLGGSVSLMAVCTILSGIFGVLIGDQFFNLLRVPSNDFITRGVALGINCGAIATAHLLNVDPRAASVSSLSFSVFGTVMVILASIGAVRDLINSWVGL